MTDAEQDASRQSSGHHAATFTVRCTMSRCGDTDRR
jgi:hypothetical protein